MSRPPQAAAALIVCALAAAAPTAAEWPRHRGPAQSGVVPGNGSFTAPAIALELVWKRPLGTGYAGIVVDGGLAVTLAGDGTDDLAIAFDPATGEERWRHPIAATYRGHHGSEDGPLSTPALADGAVYGLGPWGDLFALRLADGAPLWQRRLDPAAAPPPDYGFATSPLVIGELVVVMTGHPEGGGVTAFDRDSGRPVWSAGNDGAGYGVPLAFEVAGRPHLAVAGEGRLAGFDPATGAPRFDAAHGLTGEIHFAQPVALGDGRLLVNGWDGSAAFRIRTAGDAVAVEEIWRSGELKRSFSVPVAAAGYVFGWNGRFLTCLDPATGASVWKSRQPRGNNVSVIGGHLAIVGHDGALVLAEATAAGYLERARLPVFAGGSQTAPTFAHGLILVRDRHEMAALRVVPAAADHRASGDAAASERAVVLTGALAELAALLETHADPQDAVDRFVEDQPVLPLIEADGTVHFLWQGDAQDVALKGNVLGFDPNDETDRPLTRVAGTDLFVTSLSLDPAGHFEYRFDVDYGNVAPDPRNPHRVGSLFGEMSELRMPRWAVPRHIDPPTGPRGWTETVTVRGTSGDERILRVYLPAGYADGGHRHPLLLVHHGQSALEDGRIDRTLDNLAGRTVLPTIAVFLPSRRAELGGPDTAAYARWLARELVPWIDRRYRTRARPDARAIIGVGSGAFAAMFIALAEPGVFGHVAAQSLYFPTPEIGDALLDRVAATDRRPLSIYLEWSRHDIRSERLEVDAAAHSQRLARALAERGYAPHTVEVVGAAGWGSWRAQTDDLLERFFPLAPAAP